MKIIRPLLYSLLFYLLFCLSLAFTQNLNQVQNIFTSPPNLPARGVAFSPDGSLLAVALLDGGSIKILDAHSGSQIASLVGHTNYVNSVAFSPDGNFLASASDDTSVKIWNTNNFSLATSLEQHTNIVWSVAFSPDGDFLASASFDKTVKIWNASDFSLATSLEQHSPFVYSVAFSPRGDFLASASRDNSVKIWNTSDFSLATSLEQHSNWVYSVAFSPDGTFLASASKDKTVKIWNTSNFSLATSLEQHSSGVTSVAFSPDGDFLASASYDNSVKIWNVNDSYSLVKTIEGANGSDYFIGSVAFHPAGTSLAFGNLTGGYPYEGVVSLWATPSRQAVFCPSGCGAAPPEVQYATVTINSTAGARVTINGQAIPESSSGVFAAQLAAGAYSLHLEKEGYDSRSESLQVALNQNNTFNFSLRQREPVHNYQLSITSPWHNRQLVQPQLALSLDMTPPPSQAPQWQMTINGQRVAIASLTQRDIGVARAGDTREYNFTALMPSHIPADSAVTIEVAAFDASNSLLAEASVQVLYSYAAPVLPNLYILAVGVDDYQHPNISDLSFAAHDASTFAALFDNQAGKTYGQVVPTVLTNQHATAQQVRSALGRLFRQVQANDVVMVFFSGHGDNAEVAGKQKYYVILHDTQLDNYEGTALPQRDLEDFVRTVQGDVFMFIDTCHSGMPGKATPAASAPDGLVRDIGVQRDTPAVAERDRVIEIFAASQGNEYAQEDSAWGHGAFTKSIVEGIREGEALDYEGVITNLSLFQWVDYRVRQLTNQQQHPDRDGEGGSFIIWQP